MYGEEDRILLRRLDKFVDSPEKQDLVAGRRGLVISDICFQTLQRRDLAVTSGPEGAYTTKSSQPTTVIDALQAALVCARAGAQYEAPNGDWSALPRVASVGSASWVDPDGGTIDETSMTFSSASRSAKLVSASVDIFRMLNIIIGRLPERVVLRELIALLARAMDAAALVGTGTDGQPLGIANVPGVDSQSGEAYALATALAQIKAVENANGNPTAFIMSPTVKKTLAGREKIADSGIFLVGDDGRMAGVPVLATTGIDDDTIILGDFSRLLICIEALEAIVNPYTQGKAGTTEIVLLSFCDVVVEHPAVFSVATSVS